MPLRKPALIRDSTSLLEHSSYLLIGKLNGGQCGEIAQRNGAGCAFLLQARAKTQNRVVPTVVAILVICIKHERRTASIRPVLPDLCPVGVLLAALVGTNQPLCRCI